MITPLMLVAATGREQFLDILFEDPDIAEHINDQDKNGDTPLHHAFQSTCAILSIYHNINMSPSSPTNISHFQQYNYSECSRMRTLCHPCKRL